MSSTPPASSTVDRKHPSAVLRTGTAIWVAATAVQVVVWAMICVLDRHLVSPWWLWTAVLGGLLVLGVRLLVGRTR